MVTLARRAERVPFAPAVAVMFGLVAAILTGALPQAMFESAVVATGLPSIVPFAVPPLGMTARLLAIVIAFVAVGGVLWLALKPVSRWLDARGQAPFKDEGYADAPARLRGAQPTRRPIFAPEELGAPLMSDEAIAVSDEEELELLDVVADDPVLAPFVDEPELSEAVAFEETLPETTATRSMASFAEEQELAAPVTIEEAPVEYGPVDNSIRALIARLEAGLARRAAMDPDPHEPGGGSFPSLNDWIMPDPDVGSSTAEDDVQDRMPKGLRASNA